MITLVLGMLYTLVTIGRIGIRAPGKSSLCRSADQHEPSMRSNPQSLSLFASRSAIVPFPALEMESVSSCMFLSFPIISESVCSNSTRTHGTTRQDLALWRNFVMQPISNRPASRRNPNIHNPELAYRRAGATTQVQ